MNGRLASIIGPVDCTPIVSCACPFGVSAMLDTDPIEFLATWT